MNTNATPKDFFLNFGATIALYVSAIAFINLAFSIINRIFPDSLSYFGSLSGIIWPVSILIILMPVVYILEYFIEGKDIWIRKWRIYVTIFLTSTTIAATLITLLNTYLNGEISTRFSFKIIAVFIVSGIMFTYYLIERKRNVTIGEIEIKKRSREQLTLAWSGALLTLALIVTAFAIVGSPAKQRALRFDNQRSNDLSNIQSQIISYWQRTGSMPPLLGLGNAISPLDPETGITYEYHANNLSFELCANFSASSTPAEGGYGRYPVSIYEGANFGANNFWTHGAGRTCFTSTIDPKLYPVLKQ